MDNDTTISTLNGLIATLKDGEEGFRTAAEGLTDAGTKALFAQYARERGEMARSLQSEVTKLGGEPADSGSVAGSVHRGWINIKSAVTGRSDAAIISEAERGEDIAKKAFSGAVTTGLAPSVRTVVEQQAVRVRSAHDRVRSLERAATHS